MRSNKQNSRKWYVSNRIGDNRSDKVGGIDHHCFVNINRPAGYRKKFEQSSFIECIHKIIIISKDQIKYIRVTNGVQGELEKLDHESSHDNPIHD